MNVSFHLHTPPPAAPLPGAALPPSPGPVVYVRIEGPPDPHSRTSQVVDRAATEDDRRRYRKAWMTFEAAQAKASSARADGEAAKSPGAPMGGSGGEAASKPKREK